MNVPKQFWGDVLTACYLINRMSSSVFYGGIPYCVLYPTKSLFALPPRVFGWHLFMFILQVRISYLLALLNVSLLDTLAPKKDINVRILKVTAMSLVLMLHCLKVHPFLHPQGPL